jgi:hypothetical protein
MSGRSRTMGAGFASSTASKISVNGNSGGGSKKQGLAPLVGLNFWSNREVRFNVNNMKKTDRTKVFCMNQLGGVGAGKSQFGTANSFARPDAVLRSSPACRQV